MEILRQHSGPIHAIFVAIGGGGLIAGIAAYVKAVRPEIKIIGVQTTDSDAMAQSLAAGRRITLPDVGLFSDGTAVQAGRRGNLPPGARCMSTRSSWSTPTPSARRSRTYSRIPAASWSRPARWSIAGAKAYIERAAAGEAAGEERDPGRDRLRRQHELRPAALGGRAGRARRGARGGVRRDHPGAARQLPPLLRTDRRRAT